MCQREGGLVLCQCGHTKAFHAPRPLWYKGPMSDNAPCAHCESCKEYVQGEYQGLDMRMEGEGHGQH